MRDVIILFGGRSSERLVSVASAQNVARRLPTARLYFQAQTGAVYQVAAEQLARHERAFEVPFEPTGAPRWPTVDAALADPTDGRATWLLALHGGEGENGTLQALCERHRVAFTGSGAKASADAFDKAVARSLVQPRGVMVAQAELLEVQSADSLAAALSRLMQRHERWVLKPVADGSSYGLVHLKSAAQVPEAAAQVAATGLRYIAEQFVAGRELTVGVYDAPSGVQALPVSEVRIVADGAFDYAGKYLGRGTEEITPAQLTAAEWSAAQHVAVTAHQAIGCFGYSRTDMILTAQGPTFLETNTLPGLTRASFIPQQLEAAGLPFEGFLERQLSLAEARNRR